MSGSAGSASAQTDDACGRPKRRGGEEDEMSTGQDGGSTGRTADKALYSIYCVHFGEVVLFSSLLSLESVRLS